MTQICKTTTLGGYNVLSMTIGFFKNHLHPTTQPKADPIFFEAEDYTKFTALGVTDEDLVILETNRAKARELIRESMILLYENSDKVISGWEAKNIIMNIAEHQETKTGYLSAAEIKKIASGHITSLDTSWVLHQTNVDGIEALVKNTNLSVRGAFDFFETLSHSEKVNLEKILHQAYMFIQENFSKLSHLSLDEEFAEINAVFAGEASKHNRLQTADLPPGLSPKFIKITFSNYLKKNLLLPALRRHLDADTMQLQQTIAAQTPLVAKSMIESFQMWTNCKVAYNCPNPIPEPQINLVAPQPRAATFSSTLSKIILGTDDHDLTLEEVTKIIDRVAQDDKSVDLFKYAYFQDKMRNNSDPAEVKALFTAQFKAQLAKDMTYDIINYQAQRTIISFIQDTLFRPFDIGRQLANELNAAISCYFIIDSAKPLLAQACNSTWKVLESLAINATKAVTETQPAQIASPTAMYAPVNVVLRDESLDSKLPAMTLLVLGLGGLATSSYVLYNLFKRKPAVNPTPHPSEKVRLLRP